MLRLKTKNNCTAKKINMEYCEVFSDIILISGSADHDEVPYYWMLYDKNKKPPLKLAIDPVDKMICGFSVFCVKEDYQHKADIDYSDTDCLITEGYEIDIKIFEDCQDIIKCYDEAGVYSITICENKIICIFNNHIVRKRVQCTNMEFLLTKYNKIVGFILLDVEDSTLSTAKKFFGI